MSLKRLQIGKILVERQLVSQEQLDMAIIYQTISGKKLGEVLIELGFLGEDQFLDLLSKQLDLPLVDLSDYQLDFDLVKLLPENIARRNQCIVLKKIDNQDIFLVGMVDPQDLLAYDEIVDFLKKPIQVVIVRKKELTLTLNVIYH